MNAKTEVDTAGGELVRAPAATKRVANPGREAGDRQATPQATKVPATERISVDPMRATDRYRLVVPFSLRV